MSRRRAPRQATLEKCSNLQAEARACHGHGASPAMPPAQDVNSMWHSSWSGCHGGTQAYRQPLPLRAGERPVRFITNTWNRVHGCCSNRLPLREPELLLQGQQCRSSCLNRADVIPKHPMQDTTKEHTSEGQREGTLLWTTFRNNKPGNLIFQ